MSVVSTVTSREIKGLQVWCHWWMTLCGKARKHQLCCSIDLHDIAHSCIFPFKSKVRNHYGLLTVSLIRRSEIVWAKRTVERVNNICGILNNSNKTGNRQQYWSNDTTLFRLAGKREKLSTGTPEVIWRHARSTNETTKDNTKDEQLDARFQTPIKANQMFRTFPHTNLRFFRKHSRTQISVFFQNIPAHKSPFLRLVYNFVVLHLKFLRTFSNQYLTLRSSSHTLWTLQ